ncbi:UDP-2,3-diacetamido-2,3-dideoxy-D-glucuronate 2-epimerase [compost metagenome]
MRGIFEGLEGAGQPVILPLHPRTRNKLQQINLLLPSNIHVVEPVGYLEMVWLEANCNLVATDSGGVQKEAYFHQKPCVTLRDETEWVELVEGGFNTLAGADAGKINCAINKNLKLDFSSLLYGDGQTSKSITETLKNPNAEL